MNHKPAPVGFEQEQSWRERSRQQTTITDEQIEAFRATCRDFGPQFQGVADRIENVEYYRSLGTEPQRLAEAVVELLTSVNPSIAARNMGWTAAE